ncbi:MAG: Flavin reductase [Fibrobacteres bacterium]|nr:Flavin reductase [Fibrobacterota bacterium]
MRLFVIGATGRTGQEILSLAIPRGHTVTAYVRSPQKIASDGKRIAVWKGSPTDEERLAEAMQNHDAVFSVLGPVDTSMAGTLLQKSALATTRAMKRAKVERLAILSAAALFPGFLNGIARRILRVHMEDCLAMEKIVESSGLEWTIARPPRLTGGGSTTYRSREGAPPKMGFVLSRRAVASFMLDVVEQKSHLQKIVGIAK